MKITDFIKAHKAPVGGATAIIATAAFVLGTNFAGTPTVNLHQAADTTPDSSTSAPASVNTSNGTVAQVPAASGSDGSVSVPKTTNSDNTVKAVAPAAQTSNPAPAQTEAQKVAAAPTVVSSTQCFLYTPFNDPTLQNPNQVSYNPTAEYQVDTYSDGSSTVKPISNFSVLTNRGVVPNDECAGDAAPQS
jgi:hypothetical protein